MSVKIEFETSGAAFSENTDLEIEILLAGIAGAIALGETEGPVRDTNGNTVGSWEYTKEDIE